MTLRRLIPIVFPIPFVLTTGCADWVRDIVRQEIKQPVAQIIRSVDETQKFVNRIESHLSYCSDEVKGLLGLVQKQCQQQLVCTNKQLDIEIEVLKIDPSREGRFLSLMQDRRHQAFYFQSLPRELTDFEKKQLRDLVRPAWLDQRERKTRFLVVSHPENETPGAMERAESRGWKVIYEIAEISAELTSQSQGGKPPTAEEIEPPPAGEQREAATQMIRNGRVMHWIFPFSVRGEKIRAEDRPQLTTEKLSRSVWVYRVDC